MHTLNKLSQALLDADELLEMAAAENDQETLDVIEADLEALDADISRAGIPPHVFRRNG